MHLRSYCGNQCQYCTAPVKSVFETGPARPNLRERKYEIDTKEYKITRYYDEEFQLEKGVKKPLKTKKRPLSKSTTYSTTGFSASNALTQQFSGETFITEYENFIIDINTAKNQLDAENGRKMWNSFKKKLKVHQYKQKTTNAGPEWFQDLSPYQMELTDNLHLMLHGDIEEAQTPRTQEYLFNIGISPEIPPKIVAQTAKESGGNPIVFLFKIHKRLVEIETEAYEKAFLESKKTNKKKSLSPYSINEKILLTCVFHIHYPTFKEKLNVILPPAEKEPKILLSKKPPRKKYRYSSPYLEPLPINEKPWYEERAEEELVKKIQARLHRDKIKQEKEEFEKKLIEQKKISEREKEDKENKRKTTLFKKKKENKLEHYKKCKSMYSDNMFASSTYNESQNSLLPLRERKSMYFRNLGDNASEHRIKQQSVTGEGKLIVQDHNMSADDIEMRYKNDPMLWIKVIASEGCSQTPIKGIGGGCLYASYVPDLDTPKEGTTEPQELKIQKAPSDKINSKWTQTIFTKKFQPLKKHMRDFMLKQRVVEKQMERFYQTALHKRGIFGAPSDNVCKTNCLRDLEEMAVYHEISVIKPPSVEMLEEISSQEDLDMFMSTQRTMVPRDLSMKEILTVRRHEKDEANVGSNEVGDRPRRMSGPPLPMIYISNNNNKQDISEMQNKWSTDFLPEKKPMAVECPDQTCGLISMGDLPMDELELARRRIAELPPKKQLVASIQYLCEKGDPVAVLPNIEQVPWLIRWFDQRRGVKRVLTKKDKDELMNKSIDFWNAEYKHCTTAPPLTLPKGNYTWYNKKWMMDLLDKKVYEHRRSVKHILIDNARDLFPSMYTEYFNTPLNKAYRHLFYTYFPSCERDCLVNRPWDPSEDKAEQENNGE